MSARIFSLFVGLLTLASFVGNLLWPGFDGTAWWINFGHLPSWLHQGILGLSSVLLLAFAFRWRSGAGRSTPTVAAALVLAGVATVNAIGFYIVLLDGRIVARFPVPLSCVISAGMLLVALEAWRGPGLQPRYAFVKVLAGGCILLAASPLALMLFFGNTDYRRPADVAVVFGARVYADGRMSDALEDRIRTGCQLYASGLVKRLVLSGGPGNGAVTEAEAMREYALRHGVPAEDIIVDDGGLNTEATVRDTVPLIRSWHAGRVLAVSHFYHLPRIKLAYQRAGVDICTVPARQGHVLGQLPFNMAREVAAFWSYYIKEKPVTVAGQGRA